MTNASKSHSNPATNTSNRPNIPNSPDTAMTKKSNTPNVPNYPNNYMPNMPHSPNIPIYPSNPLTNTSNNNPQTNNYTKHCNDKAKASSEYEMDTSTSPPPYHYDFNTGANSQMTSSNSQMTSSIHNGIPSYHDTFPSNNNQLPLQQSLTTQYVPIMTNNTPSPQVRHKINTPTNTHSKTPTDNSKLSPHYSSSNLADPFAQYTIANSKHHIELASLPHFESDNTEYLC